MSFEWQTNEICPSCKTEHLWITVDKIKYCKKCDAEKMEELRYKKIIEAENKFNDIYKKYINSKNPSNNKQLGD